VQVVSFQRSGGTAGSAAFDASALTAEDFRVLDAIEQVANGNDAAADIPKVRPAQMIAALVRLMIRKGLISELEFLDELGRK
jgi:hypothetical protein